MEPTNPVHPHNGEAAVSLEVGLIVLGIGAIIFVFLIWKLTAEYRARKAQRDDADASSAAEPSSEKAPDKASEKAPETKD